MRNIIGDILIVPRLLLLRQILRSIIDRVRRMLSLLCCGRSSRSSGGRRLLLL
jgi:hypothetical protein